jgi:hypothetical protein
LTLYLYLERPKSIQKPIIEKHFVCRNNYCGNRCRGNHDSTRYRDNRDSNHCNGFAFLYHNCEHHCGPTQECFRCNKPFIELRECNKCQSRYCQKCCFK